ncbi:sulfurtransferase [Malonomonas rubra]|uniref:sulfurtransferase n=1 Tax=Malonomonas rubra TaxID=57040 RepID=UPI0026EA63E0|nr:rhodanese-like domain-containing protein [Malonomonas rubra]
MFGALSLDWQQYTKTDEQGIAYRKLPNREIAQLLGRLGIHENSPVLIYGDADSSWGGEGWVCWLLRTIGHVGEIYLLDGGIQAWRSQHGELTGEEPTSRPPVDYTVREHPEFNIETAELVKQKDLQLVDTRFFFEWLAGAIPGAVRISWSDFYRGEERRPIDRQQLVALLREHGVDPQKPIVYYCSGGIRSAYVWTVHELAGLPSAKNYEGGKEAWGRR